MSRVDDKYLELLRNRYRTANKKERTAILDDFVKTTPGSVFTMQSANPYNTAAHRDTTGKEILDQTDNQVDAWVASVGTGGTLLGVAEVLKEVNPNVKVIAIEPEDIIHPRLKSRDRIMPILLSCQKYVGKLWTFHLLKNR